MAFCTVLLPLSRCHWRCRLGSVCVCVSVSGFNCLTISLSLPVYLISPSVHVQCTKHISSSFFSKLQTILSNFIQFHRIMIHVDSDFLAFIVSHQRSYLYVHALKKSFQAASIQVCAQILYYSLRLMANLFPNCLDRQGKVRAPFGQSISQRPVSTSFSRWSTLNICFYERRACDPKAPVPVAESWHCLENVNVPLKVLEAI